jgi:serine/threonine protein kinase
MGSTQLQRFVLHGCLGRGGFGEVYRATMTSPGGLTMEVAVKLLRPEWCEPVRKGEGQALERLRDEGRLLAGLHHSVILHVFDLIEVDGRIGLVTEFVDGLDLADCFDEGAPLSARAMLQVVGTVSNALFAAWETIGPRGEPLALVHRDIKPSNIRLSRYGDVKLLDFGIARSDAFTREAKTGTNMMIGSLPYMAPERFLSNAVDPKSDVFALGCVLYEGLAGRLLFGDFTAPMMAAMAVSQEQHETYLQLQLELLAEDVDEPLVSLLGRLLAFDSAIRPGFQELTLLSENLAADSEGESLLRWCQEADWSLLVAQGESDLDGPLAGRVVEATPSPSTEVSAPSRGGWPVLLGLLAFSGGVLLIALLALINGLWSVQTGQQPAQASTLAAQEAAPEAEVQPPLPPTQTVEIEDASFVPAPAVQPVARATVGVKGEMDVQFRSGGVVKAPGKIPVGRWTIYADFGSGAVEAGTMEVKAGARYLVTCSHYRLTCKGVRQ